MHAVVRRRVPTVGLVILAAAALGTAFTTPSMRLLEAHVPGVDPLMLSLWRFTAALLMYTPFFAYRAARNPEVRLYASYHFSAVLWCIVCSFVCSAELVYLASTSS
jgi:hypothetical protein